MTQDFFKAQMKRLQTHFGDRHFNPEFFVLSGSDQASHDKAGDR